MLSAVGSSASCAGERRFGDAAHSPWATAIHQPVGPSIQSRPCTQQLVRVSVVPRGTGGWYECGRDRSCSHRNLVEPLTA